MRLVILTQYFVPEMGAPQSRLLELALGLKKLGVDVSVVTVLPNYPTGKIFPEYRGKFSTTEDIDGIKVRRYWLYASNSVRALPRILSMASFSITALASVFFIRGRRPDYLLVESPPLTVAFTGWILSKLSGSKLVMNVSDLWPLSARELGAINDGFLYSTLEKLERFLYNRSALCIGQSDEIVSHIRAVKLNSTYLFRNGVDTSRFSGSFDPGKRQIIVYAGLLGVAQGIFSICKNIDFKSLGVEFHIFGSGAELEKIVTYLDENPDRGIKYMGVLSRGQMPSTLTSYGAALIPLVRNILGAVPSKIYEAMAAGLPILFSGEGEGAKIIREHQSGWVNNPGDWETLAVNINQFKNLSQESFHDFRSKNRNVAKQYFDRSKQIHNLSEVLYPREKKS
jgi:glycosyltransferase involved in cell wall biosynthesis